jgi:hypothetical protein
MIGKIKTQISAHLLKRSGACQRDRKGCDLNKAMNVAILCEDTDENGFKLMRKLAKQIKDEFGVRHVRTLFFINGTEKDVPVYQAHKLESDFITREDLSWKLSSSNHLKTFLNEEFDILIDLADSSLIPLEFVVRHSRAHMKIGNNASPRSPFYDISINLPSDAGVESLFREIVKLLSNFTFR